MAYLKTDSFIYNGICSEQYDLVIGWIDDTPEFKTGLNCFVEKGNTNFVKYEANQYGVTYSDVITLSFVILHRDGSDFSYEESRSINNWLRGTDIYQKLHFNDQNPEFINYYAICTDIEDVVYSGINGKKITFTCNSPFGYTNEITKKMVVSSENNMSIINTSDVGIYYPIIKIEAAKDFVDKITIENINDKKSVTFDFSKIPANDENKRVVMDTKQMTVTDGTNLLPFYKIGWNDDYSSIVTDTTVKSINYIYWFRLLKGINKLKITGNCTVYITCEFPRKVGVL